MGNLKMKKHELHCSLLAHYFLIAVGIFYISTQMVYTNYYYSNNKLELYFVLIIILIMPISINVGNLGKSKAKILNILLILIEIFLLICFFTKNLLIFYVAFETILIPMYLLIGLEGQGFRKIKAAYLLFLYTLFGSFFMLFAIFYLYIVVKNFNYAALQTTTFSFFQQKLLCFCFLIAFAVKIPCVPFHLWLPEAHVEASTVGSIILASLILKLPGYGLINFVLQWFPYACVFYENCIQTVASISIIYTSLSAFRQLDLKKIIAYTSVAHMNLVILGIFSTRFFGTFGAIYLMIGHAIVSSALFFCIGVLYVRFHSKNIYYFGGLAQIMPLFSIFFFFFSLANLSFPGTCNFVGEIVIFSDLMFTNPFVLLICSLSIIFSAIYSVWVFNRLCFNTLKTKYLLKYKDLTFSEFAILLLFTILTFGSGLNSDFFFNNVKVF